MPGLINPIGVGTAALYPKQATAGAPLDPLVSPGDTNPPILFEPPPALTAGDLETWIIAHGDIPEPRRSRHVEHVVRRSVAKPRPIAVRHARRRRRLCHPMSVRRRIA